MAVYNSIQMTPPTAPISGVGIGGRTSHHGRAEIVINTALLAGDTINLMQLMPRCRILSGYIKSDAVDTGSAVTYNVGIPGTPALFFSGSTVGRTGGGVDRNMAFAGVDYVTPGKTNVILTVGAAPATGATGGRIVVVISYMNEEPY